MTANIRKFYIAKRKQECGKNYDVLRLNICFAEKIDQIDGSTFLTDFGPFFLTRLELYRATLGYFGVETPQGMGGGGETLLEILKFPLCALYVHYIYTAYVGMHI